MEIIFVWHKKEHSASIKNRVEIVDKIEQYLWKLQN